MILFLVRAAAVFGLLLLASGYDPCILMMTAAFVEFVRLYMIRRLYG